LKSVDQALFAKSRLAHVGSRVLERSNSAAVIVHSDITLAFVSSPKSSRSHMTEDIETADSGRCGIVILCTLSELFIEVNSDASYVQRLLEDFEEAWGEFDFSSCKPAKKINPETLLELLINAGKVRYAGIL
jgi:hypothetical protein